MGFPLYIAKRYLFSKSRNNAINIITLIAAIGVIIGAAALLIVLSGFAGLKDYTLAFSSFVDPDLKVLPLKGKSFELDENIIAKINANPDIASYSEVIEERVILGLEDKNEAVTLKGVDENYPSETVDSILSRGQWLSQQSNQIVAGWGIASNLSFGVFDFNKSLKIYVPKPGKGQISSVKGAFNSVTAVNAGVFEINENLDYSMVYANIDMARHLLNYSDSQVSAIELSLSPEADQEKVIAFIDELFDSNVETKNRFQLNDGLYKMLNTENLAVYLIFTLVMIIALFNVIGSIIMMILDKKNNLGTLYNLGATVGDIRKIFFLQGSLMVVLGGLIGVIIGALLVWIQKITGFVPITPTLAYPVKLTAMNVILVLVTISVLGILASMLASRRISKNLIQAI